MAPKMIRMTAPIIRPAPPVLEVASSSSRLNRLSRSWVLSPPSRRPIRPRCGRQLAEAVAHTSLVRLQVEAPCANRAPAIEHDRGPCRLWRDAEGDDGWASALLAVVAFEFDHLRTVTAENKPTTRRHGFTTSRRAAAPSPGSPNPLLQMETKREPHAGTRAVAHC